MYSVSDLFEVFGETLSDLSVIGRCLVELGELEYARGLSLTYIDECLDYAAKY